MKYSDFKHMSVPGDGSCFFHSVAQILLLEDLEFTDTQRARLAKSLRKECVDWLENNLDYRIKGIGLTIEDEINELGVQKILYYKEYIKTTFSL